MKKLVFFLMVFLVGCQPLQDSRFALINNGRSNIEIIDEEAYIPVDALKDLDVTIKQVDDTIIITDQDMNTSKSLDRPYVWYVDQGSTGEHSGDNCGPSVTIMAALWQNEFFDNSAESARMEFRSSGGWWYTDDIEDYFDKHDIEYDIANYYDAYNIIDVINDDDIVILCLDTSYISYSDDTNSKFGRFYSYEGGHFLIVKGYVYYEGELYFEVYDSNCWGDTYPNGVPKGIDRLYKASEVEKALLDWWDHYFVVE